MQMRWECQRLPGRWGKAAFAWGDTLRPRVFEAERRRRGGKGERWLRVYGAEQAELRDHGIGRHGGKGADTLSGFVFGGVQGVRSVACQAFCNTANSFRGVLIRHGHRGA